MAAVWQEGKLWVAQCQEHDIASQGGTAEEALENLKEALEFYFEPPVSTHPVPAFELIPMKVKRNEARVMA